MLNDHYVVLCDRCASKNGPFVTPCVKVGGGKHRCAGCLFLNEPCRWEGRGKRKYIALFE